MIIIFQPWTIAVSVSNPQASRALPVTRRIQVQSEIKQHSCFFLSVGHKFKQTPSETSKMVCWTSLFGDRLETENKYGRKCYCTTDDDHHCFIGQSGFNYWSCSHESFSLSIYSTDKKMKLSLDHFCLIKDWNSWSANELICSSPKQTQRWTDWRRETTDNQMN